MALNYINKFWTASIRRQLMLGIMLVHAVLMSIFVYDLVERQRVFLHLQSVEQAKSLSKTLAANSASWVLMNDVIGLEETLLAQVNYPSLGYAMVLSPEGRVLGHTETNKVGLYINDPISEKLLTVKKEQTVLVNNNLSIDIASPILSNGVFIGWARVSLSQKGTAKNLQIITRNGLLYTFLAIVIGALFAFFMARGITRGLKNIVDVAEGVKKGNQKLRADTSRHDEIGQLGVGFNIMLETVRKSKRDLQAIMDNSPALIYVKDLNGRFTFINKRCETIFELKREEFQGKTSHEIFSTDVADEMQNNDMDVLKTGHILESEERIPLRDGMHIYRSVKFPLYDDNENIYAVCGISTDISAHIKMEKEKYYLEHQLNHTQKMQSIGQLTGGIAHDFNNLLAVILGYTELSQELFAKDNEVLNSYLNEIYTAGKRGRELIEQMMIFSRKDRNKEILAPMKLDSTVEQTINMLRATFPTNIIITTSIDKNIPQVKSNSSLITQIVMNLCINAKDSMDKDGELDIALNVESMDKQRCNSCHENFSGEFVVINIKDNGKGMAEDILERMFEPFFTSKNLGEGTGMGLSVVHGVVHKLGGHIVVISHVAEGTHFKIALPVSDVKCENESVTKIDYIEPNFSGLSIMIVDDEPAVVGYLEAMLKKYQATVKTFTDSQEALDYFELNPKEFDIVITDQTMPTLTGVSLSQYILALRSDISIILCTGYSADITAETAYEIGIKAFMHKPIDSEKLYNIINKLKQSIAMPAS
ncbi:MAG: response regulator [Gammaproteobacteria bacterium]|nr:response regulator [Gammaproteobacteria bacterium]